MKIANHSATEQAQPSPSTARLLSRPAFAAIVLAMFCAVVPSLCRAQQGVILYRGVVSGDQFVIASEFTSVDSFPTVTNFVSPGGRKGSVPTGSVVEIIRYPNLASASITTDQEVGALEKMLADFAGRAKRYPKAGPVLQPWIQKLNIEIQMYRRNGKVKVGGSWVSKEEFEKGRGADAISELTISGKTYKRAKLSGLKGSKVAILHDGGVAQLEIGDLSISQIEQLNTTSSSIQLPKSAEERGKLAASVAAAEAERMAAEYRAVEEQAASKANYEKDLKSYASISKEIFVFSRKDSFDDFPIAEEFGLPLSAPPEWPEYNLFEAIEGFDRGPLAFVITTESLITEQGRGIRLWVKRLGSLRMTKENGFDANVSVYRQITKAEIQEFRAFGAKNRNLIEQMAKVQEERQEASGRSSKVQPIDGIDYIRLNRTLRYADSDAKSRGYGPQSVIRVR